MACTHTHENAANSTSTERDEFLLRIKTAKMAANKSNARYLVNLIGYVTLHEPMSLAWELPKNGDLLSYLKAQRTVVSRQVHYS